MRALVAEEGAAKVNFNQFMPSSLLIPPLWPPQDPAELPSPLTGVRSRCMPNRDIVQQYIPSLTGEAHHPREHPRLCRRGGAVVAPGAIRCCAGSATAVNPRRWHVPAALRAREQTSGSHCIRRLAHEHRSAQHKRGQGNTISLRVWRRRLRRTVDPGVAGLRRIAV